jgi:hypothetical protein
MDTFPGIQAAQRPEILGSRVQSPVLPQNIAPLRCKERGGMLAGDQGRGVPSRSRHPGQTPCLPERSLKTKISPDQADFRPRALISWLDRQVTTLGARCIRLEGNHDPCLVTPCPPPPQALTASRQNQHCFALGSHRVCFSSPGFVSRMIIVNTYLARSYVYCSDFIMILPHEGHYYSDDHRSQVTALHNGAVACKSHDHVRPLHEPAVAS